MKGDMRAVMDKKVYLITRSNDLFFLEKTDLKKQVSSCRALFCDENNYKPPWFWSADSFPGS